jgi:hypothetical protein
MNRKTGDWERDFLRKWIRPRRVKGAVLADDSARWNAGIGIAALLGVIYLTEEIVWIVQNRGRPCEKCGQRLQLRPFSLRNSLFALRALGVGATDLILNFWKPNQITGANAGGPRRVAIRTQWAVRVAQFWRSPL